METLIPEVLDIESLDLTALTVQTKGSVTVVNLKEIEKFEQDFLPVVKGIKLDLVTDDDFTKAKATIKVCKEVETIVHGQREELLLSQDEIAKAAAMYERVFTYFGDARRSLNTSVKNNSTKRKKEIVDNGIDDLKDLLAESPVKHGFTPDNPAIHDAIKGRSKFDIMEVEVAKVVQSETKRLQELEAVYFENLAAIALSEKNFPGLYSDKKQLALKPSDVVLPTLTAREEGFKNDARIVKEREEAEAKTKADSEKVVIETVTEQPVDSFQEPEAPPLPSRNARRSPPLPPSNTEQSRNHTLTVKIWGTSADAENLAAEIGMQFKAKMVKVEVVTP